MRYDLTDFEWSVIEPGKPGPRRKNDRRVLNGIFWVLRAGELGATFFAFIQLAAVRIWLRSFESTA
jgi:hypothetical protein